MLWWWWDGRFPASRSVLQSFPWSTSSARIKEDGREQELERYVHLLSKAERQREQDVDVEARLCGKHSAGERVAVLPGWGIIHSTHYLCHLQGSERLREGWNSPWPIGRDKQSGIYHSWDIHRSTAQTGKAAQCSSETCSVYFSAKSARNILHSIALLYRAGNEAW